MAAPGRPTPPPTDGGRPRFRPRDPGDLPRPDVNPYLALHRELGDLVIPANEAWKLRDQWPEVFARRAPLHLEIGAGNGRFLAGLAVAHPEWDVLGVEIRYKQTVQSARRLAAAGVRNARVIRYHAAFLDDLLADGTVHGMYLNHPDPWPKKRHDKHLLVSRWFLADAARLLVPGAPLQIKTDFAPHLERLAAALAQDPPLPFRVVGRSDDVARDGAPWPDDIETTYQRKMAEKAIAVLAIALERV